MVYSSRNLHDNNGVFQSVKVRTAKNNYIERLQDGENQTNNSG